MSNPSQIDISDKQMSLLRTKIIVILGVVGVSFSAILVRYA